MKFPLIILVCFVTLTMGCANQNAVEIAYIQSAIDNPERPEADRELDEKRKPNDVLNFFRIRSGMSVLDVFGGGGYYTEIISNLVGASGSVTLYNNNPWDDFVSKQVAERLKDNRLPNVNSVILEPRNIHQIDQKHDAAIFILGMHDIYYEDLANGWPAIDIPGFLGRIAGLIKPGGYFGVIDHNAIAGSDPAYVGLSLHRIDPAVIVRDLESAGFTLVEESDILQNSEDDRTLIAFDPAIRWQTDRSVLLFRRN